MVRSERLSNSSKDASDPAASELSLKTTPIGSKSLTQHQKSVRTVSADEQTSRGSRTRDADTAVALFSDDINETIDPQRLKRLERKIDFMILPYLAVCYAFFYIDKTTLSYAAIFGIEDDLHLKGTEYSWLSSIFYFGFLIWAFPTNFLMQKFPIGMNYPSYLSIGYVAPSRELLHYRFNITKVNTSGPIYSYGTCHDGSIECQLTMFRGFFLMLQATARNFSTLAVLRALGGAAESCSDPSFMLITSMWYTRRQQPVRIGIWYTANGLGIAGGGLLGYGIGNIKGELRSWKYEFLIMYHRHIPFQS